MDIVEFAEKILGYKLSSFQKEFLTKCYEAYASNKQLHYIPARGQNIKWMQLVFQYIAITYYWKYSGENEVKEDNKENKNDNKSTNIIRN